MLRLRTFLFLFLSLTLLALPAFAATLNVGPGQPYTTIQSAINAANTGDTVLVYPGTYYENLIISTKEITLRSSGGATSTIIDGSHQGIVITIEYTPSLATTVDGFTIRDGSSPYTPSDAGIKVLLGGATLQNDIFTGNYGYNIDAENSSVAVLNNQISTTAPNTGQPYCSAATGINLFGNLNFTSPNVVPDHIAGNVISGDGTICSGAGIYALAISTAIVENNIISNNFLGIWMYPLSAVIRQNLIYGNEQGGLHLQYELGVFPLTDPADLFVVNNTFVNNLTGLSAAQPDTADVMVDLLFAKIALSNNLIVGNSVNYPAFACLTDDPSATNSNLTPVIFDHNDVFNLNPNASVPAFSGNCSDIVPTEIGLNGNISANPKFASSTNFHLLSGSPAIDAGNNSALNLPSTDFSGNPRILDSTGTGFPIVDMGAYEASGIADAVPVSLALVSTSYYVSPPSNITLTATPTTTVPITSGTVTFFQNDVAIGTAAVTASGNVSLPVSLPLPGLYRYTATFSGVSGLAPAISTVIYVRVTDFVPILQLASSSNPSILGMPVAFTATITSSDGAVLSPIVFTDNSAPLNTATTGSNDIATFTTSGLTLGSHLINASYAGDATHTSASAQLTQNVVTGYPTTTSLTSSLNPSTFNQPVTFTATVVSTSGTPAGSITFADGGTPLQTVPLSNAGVATFTTSSLTVGTHPITATYVPTGTFAASTGSLSQRVTGLASTSVLTASPTTAVYDGAPITLTATISAATPPGSGTPTGSVTFIVDGVPGTPQTIASGTATLSLTSLAGGPHTFGCEYSGDSTYSSSTCNAASATITPAPTNFGGQIQPVPAYAFQPISFQLILNISSYLGGNGQPVPGPDNVTLSYNLASSTPTIIPLVTNSSGIATYNLSSGLAPGTYTVTFAFAGNANLQPVSQSITLLVIDDTTGTTLTASPNPAALGQTVTLTATVGSVGPTATGTVTFLDAGTPIGSAQLNSAGVATLTTNQLALGTHPLTASYPPTGSFSGSTSLVVNEVIVQSSFNLTLSPSTLTLQAGKQGSTTVQLSSLGIFSGPLKLSFGPLPQYATGSFSSPTVTLAAGANTSATFTLQTSMLAANSLPQRPGSRTAPITLCALLVLLPLALRRRSRLRSVLVIAVAAIFLQTLTGCTMRRTPFEFVADGTYQVPITATDANNNTSTQTLTVVVTP